MVISNGIVEYRRTVKPGDFESRSAALTLTFAVEEGSDPEIVVQKVYDMAVAEVHRRIGLNGPAYAAKVEDKPVVATFTTNRAPAVGDVVMFPDGPKEVVGDKATVKAAKPKLAPDPFSMKSTAKAAPQENPTPASSSTTSPSDPMAIVAPAKLALSDTPTEITATDLQAATAAASEKKVPVATIKELICKYNGGVAGKPITDIPQETRQAFLDELKGMRNVGGA